jgi:hypothetical protein
MSRRMHSMSYLEVELREMTSSVRIAMKFVGVGVWKVISELFLHCTVEIEMEW